MGVVCCSATYVGGGLINNIWSLSMRKLLTVLIAATFASMSLSAIAASHGGAMKDDKKMEECKKMDPAKADDKMKEECKKMMDMKK
jgi:anaerobic C4-dicarboxylate transporter